MCGIGGIASPSGTADFIKSLRTMSTHLGHRGPDDEGFALVFRDGDSNFYSGQETSEELKGRLPPLTSSSRPDALIGLVHRRFSIIDPTPAGHQPWSDEVGRSILVFNGEIYNYQELRRELIKEGYGPFASQSDTEVVAVAYRAWGDECFSHFNGFWAIAIVDIARRELVLSRDRFGKKPLYVCRNGHGNLWFSSEIRPLLAAGATDLTGIGLNAEAAFLYLGYDRRDSLCGSLWSGVEMLSPGSVMTVNLSDGNSQERLFWELAVQRQTESEISIPEAISGFNEIFDDAVRIRLRADVPIAANLSGGMDSSAIVCRAQRILGDTRLQTNIIRYKDAPELDETGFAADVARFVGSDHSIIDIDSADIWNQMEQLIEQFEEPVHSPAFMTQWLGWKAIRDKGVKVILHGAAADELLAGYQYFPDIADYASFNSGRWKEYFSARPPFRLRGHLKTVKWFAKGRVLPDISNPLRRMLGYADRREKNRNYDIRYFTQWFNPDFLSCVSDIHEQFNEAFLAVDWDLSARLEADLKWLRVPFWVNAMDKSMMSIPVEVRMPFLDYRLVEYLSSLPVSYIYRDGWTKFILRESMKGCLPDNITWRKDKLGFTVPKKLWYRKHRDFIFDSLNDMKHDLGTFVQIQRMLEHVDDVPEDLLWRVTNFAVWLKQNKRYLGEIGL